MRNGSALVLMGMAHDGAGGRRGGTSENEECSEARKSCEDLTRARSHSPANDNYGLLALHSVCEGSLANESQHSFISTLERTHCHTRERHRWAKTHTFIRGETSLLFVERPTFTPLRRSGQYLASPMELVVRPTPLGTRRLSWQTARPSPPPTPTAARERCSKWRGPMLARSTRSTVDRQRVW